MKKHNILTTLICVLLLAGCGKDKISYGDSSISQDNNQVGYLALPKAIYVDMSSENFNEHSSTKADDNTVEADDSYLVTITKKQDNTILFDTTYGELKAMEEIALLPALYNIYVRSTDDVPLLGTEAHFAVSEDFSIVSKLTTKLNDLACTMSNIKVSVSFSADLLELFKADSEVAEENLNVNITLGESVARYGRAQSGEINFFQAVEASNTLDIELSGMFNVAAANQEPNYTKIEGWKQSIAGVKAGQWRNISINVDHSNAGSVDFTITITTWTYDEDIDVDITDTKFQTPPTEPELDDPENYIDDEGAPTLTLGEEGDSLDSIFTIDQNSFTLSSSLKPICTKPLIINIEPNDGATLTDMWIEFTSDNTSFNTLLEGSLGAKRRKHILPAESSSSYFKLEGNTLETTYEGMYQLYMYDGVHKATLMTKDSQGRTSYHYLTIVSSNDGVDIPQSDPPAIEWRGGKDFADSYVVDPITGLEVIIDITSETGITGFTVSINSDVLTADGLSGIGLNQTMDLINPGDCEGGLSGLGFPVGDAVKGQTSMVFDISSFMPALHVFGPGNSDFVLNVTDAGGTTSVTLHIKVE